MNIFKNQLEEREFEGLSFTYEQLAQIVASKPRGIVFRNCKLSGRDVEKLSEATSVINLTMENCKLTDNHLQYLSCLPKLEYLFLPDNKIDGSGFVHFLEHKKLSTLWLDNNPIDDNGLKIVAKLSKVSSVRIANTKVTFDGLMAVADNYKLNLLVNDRVTKQQTIPQEQMEEFEKMQRHLAKKKKESDPELIAEAEKTLQIFFEAYSKLERFAGEQENTFSEEVKEKYRELVMQYCSGANHQNRLSSVSPSAPYSFGAHRIVDNEQLSKSKIYIYTKNGLNNLYRTLLVLENGRWVIDKQQWMYEGWAKSYF